jgi:hypothetical protein
MSSETSTSTLQPWQFFVLAALGCATAVTFMVRGQGVTVVILVTIILATAALVGLVTVRVIRPLLLPQDDRTVVLGQRTRAGLEQEKTIVLRSIKELEFDRAMGKVSEEDFKEMSTRLRARAARLLASLDAGAGYRQQIERDLAKRLGEVADKSAAAAPVCARCSTTNDRDAKFCKACGEKL